MLVHRAGDSADRAVSFVLDRCFAQVCVGGCIVSDVSLTLGYQGRTDVVSGDQIEYTPSHHNFSDALVGTLPDRRIRWRFELEAPNGELHFLSVEALDGAVILPETSIHTD